MKADPPARSRRRRLRPDPGDRQTRDHAGRPGSSRQSVRAADYRSSGSFQRAKASLWCWSSLKVIPFNNACQLLHLQYGGSSLSEQCEVMPITREIDVWLMSLFDISADLENMYLACLNESERVRLKSTTVPTFRQQYLMSRVMVRTTLSRYANVPPVDWEFRSNYYGRPFISKPISCRDLEFNLSHTSGLIACIVARGARYIGVDVEDIERTIDPKTLADFAFAPKEIEALKAAVCNKQRALFFSYWTLKEAYIKAKGLGLSIPLDSFWFDLSQSQPRVNFSAQSGDDPGRWQFEHRDITERHKIAVAVSMPAAEQVKLAFHWTTPVTGPKV